MPAHRWPRKARRAWATLWLIIWLPALLALFCALVSIANLWLARVEAENAMEAAALAAVKHWGDANGGDTLVPRQVGVAYAAANCVRKHDAVIGTSYNPAGGPNQNAVCDVGMTPPTGNLIFGAIDDTDPDNIIFNAGIQPSCGIGTVLFDATVQGGGGGGSLGDDDSWGIAFLNTLGTPANLRISRIIIDLQAHGGIGEFVLGASGPASGPTITSNIAPHKIDVSCQGNSYSQPDLVGFSNPTSQIVLTPTGGNSATLQIDFLADGLNDDGFAPCDRFRFGASTTGVGANTNPASDDDDGDGIGVDQVQVTVFFTQNGLPAGAATGTFFDNDERSSQCRCPPLTDPSCVPNPLIVHPVPIPNLPCPSASGNNNNGQSYVLLSGASDRKFGVRAQSILPIDDFGCVFLGKTPQSCVHAKATALYDCATRRPKLVRIDTFICPGPMSVVKTCDTCPPGP